MLWILYSVIYLILILFTVLFFYELCYTNRLIKQNKYTIDYLKDYSGITKKSLIEIITGTAVKPQNVYILSNDIIEQLPHRRIHCSIIYPHTLFPILYFILLLSVLLTSFYAGERYWLATLLLSSVIILYFLYELIYHVLIKRFNNNKLILLKNDGENVTISENESEDDNDENERYYDYERLKYNSGLISYTDDMRIEDVMIVVNKEIDKSLLGIERLKYREDNSPFFSMLYQVIEKRKMKSLFSLQKVCTVVKNDIRLSSIVCNQLLIKMRWKITELEKKDQSDDDRKMIKHYLEIEKELIQAINTIDQKIKPYFSEKDNGESSKKV